LETDLYIASIHVQAIDHGVVVSSARHQRRTHKSGAREPAKRFTDYSSVSSVEADGIDTTKSKRRFNEKSGQTRKSQTSGVQNDAGSHPERSTQPMVGGRYVRRKVPP